MTAHTKLTLLYTGYAGYLEQLDVLTTEYHQFNVDAIFFVQIIYFPKYSTLTYTTLSHKNGYWRLSQWAIYHSVLNLLLLNNTSRKATVDREGLNMNHHIS